jgi:hypothetical protein
MLGVDASFYYYNKDLVNAKNECAYIAHDWLFILDELFINIPIEHKCKYVQFVVIFQLLTHGCPMINYENMKPL